MKAMADREEMKALHMYTAGDPLRDPTFAYFADPNYFLTDFPTSTCKTCINPLFAWNHGDIQPEIANTWLGFVGPGVQQLGVDGQVWSDHVDVAPTIYTLLGLDAELAERRSRARSGARRVGSPAVASGTPWSVRPALGRVQAAERALRLVRHGHADRIDEGDPDGIGVERHHLHRVRPAARTAARRSVTPSQPRSAGC